MKKSIILLAALLPAFLFSQDTLTVMHYNILMYGNFTSWCTSSNNPYLEKTEHLKTIVDYVQPDILTVNEISDNEFYHNYLLDNALNVNGIDYYQMGNPSNLGDSYIVNEIYYNSQKLQLHSYTALQTNVRDIDIFRLYYLTPGLQFTGDTIFLNCVVAHLKAGQDSDDAYERGLETNLLMDYLNSTDASGNYLFMGDFNVYTNAEVAFQNLVNNTNEDIRFYDPIDLMGSWHNNDYYENIHTQSTHTSSGCPSSGGLDDRFDFILASDEIINGTENIIYIQDSYKAVGQDGLHFNQSLVSSPTNTSVPEDVLDALYDMSDHLPISLKLLLDTAVGISENKILNFDIDIINPVAEKLSIHFSVEKSTKFQIEITSVWGQSVYSGSVSVPSSKTIVIQAQDLKPGMYLLQVYDEHRNMIVKKILKD